MQLCEPLFGMERGLGLGHLAQKENDVIYAVNSVITAPGGVAKSDEIKSHALVCDMTQPIFHRCWKILINMALLAHAQNTKAEPYVSPPECDDATESA